MGLLAILKGEQPGIIATLLNYKNVGQFGEYMTEYALKNNNLKGEYIVLKNAYIPNNCIVGGGTVVTGQFNEENIVLGGNPARIVKRNVDWTHKNAYFLVNQKEIK